MQNAHLFFVLASDFHNWQHFPELPHNPVLQGYRHFKKTFLTRHATFLTDIARLGCQSFCAAKTAVAFVSKKCIIINIWYVYSHLFSVNLGSGFCTFRDTSFVHELLVRPQFFRFVRYLRLLLLFTLLRQPTMRKDASMVSVSLFLNKYAWS